MEIKRQLLAGSTLLISMIVTGYVQAAPDLVSGGITNTRHNLTQSFLGGSALFMDLARNDYGEVCVYCHTPHGANNTSGAGMPLWNRTVNESLTFELYAKPTMALGDAQNVTRPGPASLTCLSCHDGSTAIDSIINMPGSGRYNPSQADGYPNTGWLSTWVQPRGVAVSTHGTLADCAGCHNTPDLYKPDFRNFVIGGLYNPATGLVESTVGTVDLTDDHPVGMLYPTTFGPGIDFRPMDVEMPGRYAFFDNGNGRADKNEIRVYDSGEGFEVECASCHDPHGVPDSSGTTFIPSFLRVENVNSDLCLACHTK